MMATNNNFLFESSICYVCRLNVHNSGVFCEICNTWLHIKCIKITIKHYNQLAKSPLPYFCQRCISKALPLVNVTNHNLMTHETFNSNKPKPNTNICNECSNVIGHDKHIHCKLGNHSFHLRCLPLNLRTNELNHKIWSCSSCLNFPFQLLEQPQLSTELYKASNNTPTKLVKFNNDFKQFKHIPALNINLPSLDNEDNPINFNYYDIDEFLSTTRNIDSQYLSFFHTNIRSLNRNFESLVDLLILLKHEFDIIGISETWDSDQKPIGEHSLEGYHPLVAQSGKSQNAGVGLYIKDHLNYKERNDLTTTSSGNDSDFECIFIELDSNILIGVVYRHPNCSIQNFTNQFESSILMKISKENKKIVLMGDFNINLLNCDSHRHTSSFFDKMITHNLLPHIIQPTRFNGTTHTLIDNIFYNNGSSDCISGNLIPHITDHLPNFLLVPHSEQKDKILVGKMKRDFSRFDINEFREDLSNINFDHVLMNMKNADQMYTFFHTGLNLLFDMHAPITSLSKQQRRRQKNPWITQNILNKTKIKSSLYGRFMKDKDPLVHREYQLLVHEIKKETRKQKFLYLKNKFIQSKNDIKKFWKNINSFLGREKHNHFPNSMTCQNKVFTGPHQISERFNSYFSEVAPNLIKKIPKNHKIKTYLNKIKYNNSSLFFRPTNRYEVLTHLNNLNAKKAKDIYNFPINIIKSVADLIADPLVRIVNNSLSTGVFPEFLKHAKVTPLFKNGHRTDIKNYRPISILPVFDKIFEKIVHERLTEFLDKNKLLFDGQFGFQKGKSTSHAILHLTNFIHKCKVKKEVGCAIFLDLAKAFDTVNHTILIDKLEKIGVRGPVLAWFKSYLGNRKQSVCCNEVKSEPLFMSHGVPQGSVLGPLLFLIYVNDLPSNSSFLQTLFADDTCLFMSHKDPVTLQNLVNTELQKISNWLFANRLTLNISKSNYIIFGEQIKTDFHISISGQALDQVNETKYLGVIIDHKLSWKEHLKRLHTRIKQNIGILHKVGWFLPRKNLTSLYFSLVNSHLSYAITSWGSPNTCGLFKINETILKCIKYINRIAPPNERNDSFKPLNVFKLYELESCKLVHKFLNNHLPSSLNCLFQRSQTGNIAPRKNSKNNVATIHLDRALNPLMFYGPQSWNQRNCYKFAECTPSTFSSRLKKDLNE